MAAQGRALNGDRVLYLDGELNNNVIFANISEIPG